MTSLAQILAVEKGTKSSADRQWTDAYHALQKTALLSGISRTYQPREDDGERLPAESTNVILRTDDVVKEVSKTLTRMFDVIVTKDVANTHAKADVVVDGTAILVNVPVVSLLFLEKQLVDLTTFINKLPVLDVSETWTWNESANCYSTAPVETVRTKKIPKNWVKAEATDKHPAQVEIYHEDIVAGYWTKVAFSGALPATRVAELKVRVEKLRNAVQFAREEANSVEIVDVSVGEAFFGYLFS